MDESPREGHQVKVDDFAKCILAKFKKSMRDELDFLILWGECARVSERFAQPISAKKDGGEFARRLLIALYRLEEQRLLRLRRDSTRIAAAAITNLGKSMLENTTFEEIPL